MFHEKINQFIYVCTLIKETNADLLYTVVPFFRDLHLLLTN